MHIEIEIPRPFMLAIVLTASVAVVICYQSGVSLATLVPSLGQDSDVTAMIEDPGDETLLAMGGDDMPGTAKISRSEQKVRLARIEQAFLSRKEEILRYQLQVLSEEREKLGDKVGADVDEQFRTSMGVLVSLLQDQRKAEQFLKEALNELFEAEGRTRLLSRGKALAEAPKLDWPVEPTEGISAFFHDPDYRKRFGFVHQAIDIPVLQNTEIAAAADGIVTDVADNGFGFSSLTIRHDAGFATLYGHVSKFLVHKGQRVAAGDIIALSGGRPGTHGAGFSTGPHVHFMLTIDGAAVDPLDYLPKWQAAKAVSTVTDEDRANGIYERFSGDQ